jgi:hypothetical protein
MRMTGRTGDIDRTALRFALARIKQDSTTMRSSANCKPSSPAWPARVQPAEPVSPQGNPAIDFDHDKALLVSCAGNSLKI